MDLRFVVFFFILVVVDVLLNVDRHLLYLHMVDSVVLNRHMDDVFLTAKLS